GLKRNGLKKNGLNGLKKIGEAKNGRAKNGLFTNNDRLKRNGFASDDEGNMNRDGTEFSERAVANVLTLGTWRLSGFVADDTSGRGTGRLMPRKPRGAPEIRDSLEAASEGGRGTDWLFRSARRGSTGLGGVCESEAPAVR